MTGKAPLLFSDPEELAQTVIDRVGSEIVLALPLGLGKANHLVNALVERAADDTSISLTILTALTLVSPQPSSDLERRFLDPLHDRFFGGYPGLEYATLLRDDKLPDNIRVKEFYLQPGIWLHNETVQQDYQSINYTHALGFLLEHGFNVLAQLIAVADNGPEASLSLSSNPDISSDLLKARNNGEIDFLAIGQINRNLPFMRGAAERKRNDFDLLLDGDDIQFPLFTLPHEPVSLADHAIGLRVARLIPDGGTLQVGIGSIGDAIFNALLLRHRDNADFRKMLDALPGGVSSSDCRDPFRKGLYGCSEMLVEGFLHLIREDILKREVDGYVLHAGFFVGSPLFYEMLEEFPREKRDRIAMMPVSFTNQLYGQEDEKRKARPDARFVNSALMVTLLGSIVSDGLENGQVVSGVGGQYNFVAMAFALAGGRSVITLPATRTSGDKTESNVRWTYGHATIPRHLRDTVVTEYGVAELRGKSDAEVIKAMLDVTDSRFQEDLLEQAKSAGKIEKGYRIPESRRHNTPEHVAEILEPFVRSGRLSPFPLGSEFSDIEERLAVALQELKKRAGSRQALLKMAWRGWRKRSDAEIDACLDRMGLTDPGSFRDRFRCWLLRAVL